MGAQQDHEHGSRGTSAIPVRPPGFAEKIALEKANLRTAHHDRVPLLSSAEVANWLGISQRTVCLWAELGEIPGFKLGHQWRFSETEVRKWLGARLDSRDSGAGAT